MSKKLILIITMIIAVMFGAASLVKTGSKEEPAKKQISLSGMVGKPAPDFSLQNQRGQTFRLSEMRGKKTVLFFNEGIMCYPACWNQMAALGSDAALNNSEVASVSIVTDSQKQWTSAFAKMPELNKGTILFDSKKAVSSQYSMLSVDSSMHRGSTPGHTFVIVDQKGVVRYVKDDAQMGIRNDELRSELAKI